MGLALLDAWSLKKNLSFIVVDPNQYKKINLKNNIRIKSYDNISKIKKFFLIDIVIFAIKPQISDSVLKDISNIKFNKNVIFVSIIAGKKINSFNKFLPNKNKFVRVMPNMPAMINQGMTCLVANKNILQKEKKLINSLFLQVGETLWFDKESKIDKVTAISGSGPGYIFLIIDAFEKAALKLRLGDSNTKKLIHQTFLGSINLLIKKKLKASSLSENIAVKGGTTEAGLNEFKRNKILYKIFDKVVKAAYIKSKKLGK